MSQTILFVCATGIATSTAVTEKVMEYCKEQGLNVNYSQTNVASLPGNTDGGICLLYVWRAKNAVQKNKGWNFSGISIGTPIKQ